MSEETGAFDRPSCGPLWPDVVDMSTEANISVAPAVLVYLDFKFLTIFK